MFLGQVSRGTAGEGRGQGGLRVKPHPQKQPLPSLVAAERIDRATIYPRPLTTLSTTPPRMRQVRLSLQKLPRMLTFPSPPLFWLYSVAAGGGRKVGGWLGGRSKYHRVRPPHESSHVFLVTLMSFELFSSFSRALLTHERCSHPLLLPPPPPPPPHSAASPSIHFPFLVKRRRRVETRA